MAETVRYDFEAYDNLDDHNRRLREVIESYKDATTTVAQLDREERKAAAQAIADQQLRVIEARKTLAELTELAKQQTEQVKAQARQQTDAQLKENQRQLSQAEASYDNWLAAQKQALQQQTLAQKQAGDQRLADQKAQLDKQVAAHEEALRQQTLTIKQQGEQALFAQKAQAAEQLASLKFQHDEQMVQLRQTRSGVDNIISGLRDLRTLIGASFDLYALIEFSKEVVDAKGKIDFFKASLTQMIGSQSEAAAVYAQLVQLAKTTPFEVEQLMSVTTQLKGMGVATKDLLPTLEQLGNMAVIAGQDKLPLLAKAYTDVSNKQKLYAQEIRQFTDNGIPIFELLADSMKKPKEEIIKLAEAHKISFDDVKKAIQDASEVGGRYYGLMAIQAGTVAGRMSNLKDSFFLAKAAVGDFYEDGIKWVLTGLSDFIESTIGSEAAIRRLEAIIKTIVGTVVTWRAASIAATVADTAGTAATYALATAKTLYNTAVQATNRYLGMTTVSTWALTDAEVAASTATTGLWASIAKNPLGALLTVLGAVVTAYQLWDATHIQVGETMGQQEAGLRREQTLLAANANTALNAAQGSILRNAAIAQIISQFPEYFKGLSAETITNEQLREVLAKINLNYAQRIELAQKAYMVEQGLEKQNDLFKRQLELLNQVRERAPEFGYLVDKAGGSAQAFLRELGKLDPATRELFQNSMEGFTMWDKGMNALSNATKGQWNGVIGALNEMPGLLNENGKQLDTYRAQQLALEKKYGLDSTNLLKLKTTEQIAVEAAAGAAKVKNVKLTADEIKEVELEATANTAKERIKLLELYQKEEIKRVNESKATQEEKESKIAAIAIYYQNQVTGIEADELKKREAAQKTHAINVSAIRAKAYADDEAKQGERLADLQKKLAAELALVTDRYQQGAITQAQAAEREAALTRQYFIDRASLEAGFYKTRLKAIDEDEKAQIAAVKEGYKNKELSLTAANEKILDIMRDSKVKRVNLEQSTWQEISRAIDEAAKTVADAGKDRWVIDAEGYKGAKERAKDFSELQKQTAQIEKEAAKDITQTQAERFRIEEQGRKKVFALVLDMAAQESGLIGQMGKAAKAVYENWDAISGKSKDAAEQRLRETETLFSAAQARLTFLMDFGTAEQIEKQKQVVAQAGVSVEQAKTNLTKVTTATTTAMTGMLSLGLQAFVALGQAVDAEIKRQREEQAAALRDFRELHKQYYNWLLEASRDAYKRDLEAFEYSYDGKRLVIQRFYEYQSQLMMNRDGVDAQLAQVQEILDANGDARALMKNADQAEDERQKTRLQTRINQIELEKQKLKDLYDARIKEIDDLTAAAKAAIEAEIDATKEAFDTKKDIIEKERDAKKQALQDDLDTLKNNYDQQKTLAQEKYDGEVSRVNARYDAEKKALQDAYDFKRSLVEQEKADELEAAGIIDRLRNEVLERYRTTEVTKLQAQRDRILATLSDEKEKTDITNEYANRIAQVHKEVEDAKLDKSKANTLISKQLKQEEKDLTERLKEEETNKIIELETRQKNEIETLKTGLKNTLDTYRLDYEKKENELKDRIKALETDTKNKIEALQKELKNTIEGYQNQIKANEQAALWQRIQANLDYGNQVNSANQRLFEANKQMAIIDLRIAVAKLKAAGGSQGLINELNALIESIGGQGFGNWTNPTTGGLTFTPLFANGGAASGQQFPLAGILQNGMLQDTAEWDVSYKSDNNPSGGGDYVDARLAYDANATEGRWIRLYNRNSGNEVTGWINYAAVFDPATGRRYAEGTEYVTDRTAPDGVDTVRAWLTKGERVMPVSHNQQLGGISNEELVRRSNLFDKYLQAGFDLGRMRPEELINFQNPTAQVVRVLAQSAAQNERTGGGIDRAVFERLTGEIGRMRESFESRELVNIHMHEAGFKKFLTQKDLVIQDWSNRLNR